MPQAKKNSLLLLLLLTIYACHSPQPNKITFDTASISSDGLQNGVSIAYEFCIPRDSAYLEQVQKIDANVEVYAGSPGRIGCTDAQWLCISNTQQRHFRQVLRQLAQQGFIERIDRCFFE